MKEVHMIRVAEEAYLRYWDSTPSNHIRNITVERRIWIEAYAQALLDVQNHGICLRPVIVPAKRPTFDL